MPEQATTDALTRYSESLRPYLSEALAGELTQLAAASGTVSNWQEGDAWLHQHGCTAIAGHGPMSKLLRTIAYTLERLSEELPSAGGDIKATGIRLSKTVSGCSTFVGMVRVEGERDSAEVVILDGRFIWDCAAWSMPQAMAAHSRGYACMVEFPRPAFAPAP